MEEAGEDLELFIQEKQKAAQKYRRIFVAIDSLSVTLLLYIAFRIFNMDLLYPDPDESFLISTITVKASTIALLIAAFIISFPAVLLLHRRDKKQNILEIIESKYPILEEKLRTAYDNREVQNTIVPELLMSVVSATKEIPNSVVLINKMLRLTIILFFAASILTTTTTVLDYRTQITPSDIEEVIEDLPFVPDNGNMPPETSPLDDRKNPSGENITGEPSVIIVEGEEVDLTLPPGSETGFTESGDDESLPPDFKPSSSYDIGMISSSPYHEDLPEGYEDLIKSYFEEITKQ
ncbi:hypothetical protein [Methanohalophilus sp.]|uniref:DUF7502 family protein n=1 Tax=Methanohalophilus sp. TaxID=1966352 RepID=UPI0026294236|nr:hypothetical protein [Methanohalophilus sp.]MDK2891802.1 hypothetical protein [Methanohalophilus sp.]